MYFTSQPMEATDNRAALEVTFDMIRAESQLMFSTDYPHWDFDLPSVIYDLPFLSDDGRKAILGQTAQRLFKLDPTEIGRPDLVLPRR
jgi:uncharacterized protein